MNIDTSISRLLITAINTGFKIESSDFFNSYRRYHTLFSGTQDRVWYGDLSFTIQDVNSWIEKDGSFSQATSAETDQACIFKRNSALELIVEETSIRRIAVRHGRRLVASSITDTWTYLRIAQTHGFMAALSNPSEAAKSRKTRASTVSKCPTMRTRIFNKPGARNRPP
jgi:hypothetical protein